MIGILLKSGYEATPCLEEADFLVINTCGFLASAREESCSTIASLLREKKKGAKLVVTGCMVQKHRNELKEEFPEIHYLLGSGDVEKILQAIESPNSGEEVTSARSYLQWGEVPRQVATPRHYAYLKIAEGCAKKCSFCIIPSIKGPLRSKPIDQVVKEFRLLLNQGVQEIILIAQDLGDFGKERKEKNALEALLKELLKTPKDFWLRLLYLYPDEITPELIDLLASDPRLCPYLDMPIQHINDLLLKRMRRRTSKADIVATIERLRKRVPEIVIRTSLMVGFPGESEEQFTELLSFVEQYALDNIGIFTFSAERGARAATLSDQIAEEIKEERLQRLVKAQVKSVRKSNGKYIGRRMKVVVEGYHPDSPLRMRGRFYGQCPEIDGQVIINDGEGVTAFGKFYEVEITGSLEYDLIGRVVHPFGEKNPTKRLALVS
jgi:ribosomal protein S12 methylthiotransferase